MSQPASWQRAGLCARKGRLAEGAPAHGAPAARPPPSAQPAHDAGAALPTLADDPHEILQVIATPSSPGGRAPGAGPAPGPGSPPASGDDEVEIDLANLGMDGAAAASGPTLVREAVRRLVASVLEHEERQSGARTEAGFADALAEMVLQQAGALASDLEGFAWHARRVVINGDDVRLCARRNPALLDKLNAQSEREERPK
ncbi:hypothetical protein H696_02675 [Fonticula alba]|uniref:Centromere protein S n=1 Tax=Fonticula alba TaxID=691883 RepID=A0A058Z8U3_FONAL|nr:hypothetical protein H696_02675 [Fonticula alba]KCV70348.1 hypothetical protein H696_02675 [Fonticula alba]|eukprot:XP_009494864.1 hypothetical protein H696_02675 [Fonticula alba]